MMYARKSLWAAALILMTELFFSASAHAATGTTSSNLSLNATFENISVKASFTGDDNQNNSALIQYRPTGTVTWLNAYTPLIDRRASINATTNPYANQARVSIVGLVPNKSYDVQVTWTDPDGVAGSNPVTGTIATLSKTPLFGGSTVVVNNDATLTSALANAVPGQIIHLNPANYSQFAISKSGNAGAWIKVECDAGGGSIINGVGGINIQVKSNVSYVYLQYCTLGPSDFTSISLQSGTNHIFIVNNTIQAVSTTCASSANDPTPYLSRYGDNGVSISGTSTDIYVFNNAITAGPALDGCTATPVYDSPSVGIAWGGSKNNQPMQIVICDNTVTGGFRDAISADSTDIYGENVDECRNTVSGYKDDGIESKGSNVNVRLWGNIITAPSPKISATCVAANTVTNSSNNQYGPIYIFRNTCNVSTTASSGSTIFKIGGAQTYLFHNTVDVSPTGSARWDAVVDAAGNSGTYNNLVVLNNLIVTNGNMAAGWNSGAVFNNDLYQSDGESNFGRGFAGKTYDTFSSFQSGTGLESKGMCVPAGIACTIVPNFLDPALHIAANSPAVDRGVLLPNFNDSASAWPYSGAAPDIGAFEASGGGSVAPLITTQPQSQTITRGATATLSVTATGTGTLLYQWYQGLTGDSATPVAGATSPNFTTPAVTITTSYWVKVSSGGGTVNSNTATVTVGTAPSILQQPLSQTISSGATANLGVTAVGTGTLSYQWYMGTSGVTTTPVTGATANTVAISGLTSTTSYWVRISNGFGSTNSNTATVTLVPGNTLTTTMTSPANGSTVSGTVMISATAASSLGIAGVQFLLDNVKLGAEITTSPYQMAWLSPNTSNGTHTLSAVARDVTGVIGLPATPVTISVNNLAPTMGYNIPANGAISLTTTSTTNASVITVSHARILQDSAASALTANDMFAAFASPRIMTTTLNTPLSGVSIISDRSSSGVLVSEAGVPASAETSSGRIYVEISSTVNTGVALSNLTLQDATVSYYFTDTSGNDFGSGSFTLRAEHQISAFLNQPAFQGPTGFQGSFTWYSTVPLGSIAIRGFLNERSEFLMTTVPVVPVGVTNYAYILPEFVDGAGWSTTVLLTNATDFTENGIIQFFGQGSDSQAAPLLNMTLNGQTGTTFNYTLPPHAATRFSTDGSGTVVQVGSIKITAVINTPGAPNDLPSAVSLFQLRTNGNTVSQTSVIAAPTDTGFRMYMEASGTNGLPNSIQSGMAVMNPSSTPVTAYIDLSTLDGTSANVPTAVITIPAGGQIQKFLAELFPDITGSFKGVARLTSTSPLAVAALRGRYNERDEFLMTTTPPLRDSTSAGSLVFPHIVSGQGFSTQVVVFGGTGTGKLYLFTQSGLQESGTPLN
jgi:hypothetical protein